MAAVALRVVLTDVADRLRLTLALWRQRAWRRFGVSAVLLPAALTVLGGLVAWDGLNQRAIVSLEARAGAVASRPAAVAAARVAGARDDARQARERMQAFKDGLPSHEDLGDTLAAIVKLAEARHVPLAHGEYREQLDDTGAFSSYDMAFPVSADPLAVQGFIADVLQAQPYLALAHVRVQRNAVNTGLAEVRLQFVLFTRAPGAPARTVLPSAAGASGAQP